MKTQFMTPRDAAKTLGYNVDYLRQLAKQGKIPTIRTPGGHLRYAIQEYIDTQRESGITTLCYCRVSGKAQAADLASQVAYMREKFPEAEVIEDFGSGINFKRKGLQRILERLLRGDKRRIVVAHRDRLARFGGEVIRFLVEQNGGEVVVLNQTSLSPEQELTADLLEILHVFSSRMYGLRRYTDKIKEDPNLSQPRAEGDAP